MSAPELAKIPGGFPWLPDIRSALSHLPVRIVSDGTDLLIMPSDPGSVSAVLRAQVAAALGAR